MIERSQCYPETHRRRAATRSLNSLEFLLFLISVCVLLLVVGTWLKGVMAENAPPVITTITVQSGDTLWSLADKYGDPDKYILERVDQLARVNKIETSHVLHEGQTLTVPVSIKSAAFHLEGTYASSRIAD